MFVAKIPSTVKVSAVCSDRVRKGCVGVVRRRTGLGVDGLAVSRGAEPKHGGGGIDRGTEPIEHMLADDEMREGIAHALEGGAPRRGQLELEHVSAILVEWDRRNADVLARFEEHDGARTTGVGNAVSIRGATHQPAADPLHLVLRLQEIDSPLDHRKIQTESMSPLAARP